MVASVTSPADVVNLALARIGYKGRVGSLYEGSKAAKKALDVYAQTRDELLRDGDWDFAQTSISLTLLKSAPPGGYFGLVTWSPNTNPPPPWFFEYAYPADCLKVRAIKPVPLFVVDWDPEPNSFSIENDNGFAPPQKVILCNVPNAILTYTRQVTDPAIWEPDFIEALSAALGRRLAPGLMGLDVARMEVPDEAQSKQTAEMEQG